MNVSVESVCDVLLPCRWSVQLLAQGGTTLQCSCDSPCVCPAGPLQAPEMMKLYTFTLFLSQRGLRVMNAERRLCFYKHWPGTLLLLSTPWWFLGSFLFCFAQWCWASDVIMMTILFLCGLGLLASNHLWDPPLVFSPFLFDKFRVRLCRGF